MSEEISQSLSASSTRFFFTLIRLDARRKYGVRRLDQLRDYVRRRGMEEFGDVINDVENLVEGLGIIVLEDRGGLDEVLETMRRYSLLPEMH